MVTRADMSFAPFLIDKDAPVLQTAIRALKDLGIEPKIEQGGGGLDANIFNAKGLPSIGIATGYTKNHTTEETLDLDSFKKSGLLVQALIDEA